MSVHRWRSTHHPAQVRTPLIEMCIGTNLSDTLTSLASSRGSRPASTRPKAASRGARTSSWTAATATGSGAAGRWCRRVSMARLWSREACPSRRRRPWAACIVARGWSGTSCAAARIGIVGGCGTSRAGRSSPYIPIYASVYISGCINTSLSEYALTAPANPTATTPATCSRGLAARRPSGTSSRRRIPRPPGR